MPRSSTSFKKGDPRITGKKQTVEHVHKRVESFKSRMDYPKLLKKMRDGHARWLEKAKKDGTLREILEKVNRARLAKIENTPEFRYKITEKANQVVRGLMRQPSNPWRTTEYRQKMSLMKIGDKNPRIQTWRNMTQKEKMEWIQYMRERTAKRPTNCEKKFIDFVQNYKLPVKYVGDGKFWIGKFNPDFIHLKRKIVFEIFGEYWHKLAENQLRDKERMKAYQQKGWRSVIIWEQELKNPRLLLQKIKQILDN